MLTKAAEQHLTGFMFQSRADRALQALKTSLRFSLAKYSVTDGMSPSNSGSAASSFSQSTFEEAHSARSLSVPAFSCRTMHS